ncbi:MAG: hypothetical protein K1X55_17665 [Chitinophagales bacterium]|nr:hypothetical protein [Chitinophagales bacterium]
MENLELQEQIINLGKLFVKELGLEPGVDTLSRWMAHYIAEKVALIEHLPPGINKEETQKECFETILKLWEHRWSFPTGKRPLEEFEPILKTLMQLSPEKRESFFFRPLNHKIYDELMEGDIDFKEITDYINIVQQIDRIAKIWIEFVLKQAALKAKSDKADAFLKNISNLQENADVRSIRVLLDLPSLNGLENDNQENAHKKRQIDKLKRRIEDLEKFSKLNEYLLGSYKKDLEELI